VGNDDQVHDGVDEDAVHRTTDERPAPQHPDPCGGRVVDDHHHQRDEDVKCETEPGCRQPSAKRVTPQQAGRNSLEYAIGTDPSHPEGNDGVKTIQERDCERAVNDGARHTEFRHAADRTRMSLLRESPLSARLMRPLAGTRARGPVSRAHPEHDP